MVAALMTTAMWAQGVKPLPSLHVEGKWLTDTYGNHVVLHGVMDTPSAWFNNGRWGWSYDDEGRKRCLDYFEKLFTGLEKAHCTVFRLHLEPAWTNDNNYTYTLANSQPSDATGEADIKHFNPTRLKNYLNSLYFPLMKKAMNHGMYVVVRPPGVCPGNLRVSDYYQKYLMNVWDIVSKNDSVRKYSGQISIELANEPVNVKNSNNADDTWALHDYFQPVVDEIRANGFTGIIWVPGTGWQSGYTSYKTHPIEGYNIGYAVHDYDGWYGLEDKKNSTKTVTTATKNKINQFHNQVPVVDTNPIIITEIDWSPKKSDIAGHENEHGEQVEGNLGTWATGRTSVWGTITKNVYDHYGNISMTLSGTACLLDIDTLLAKDGKVVPAFGGEPEACGKACMDWYAEYYTKNWPHADPLDVPISDKGTKYENPIVRADFPDPDVIRVGDTYYMVSTTMHNLPGATILKSQDMVNWEYCAHPLQQLSEKPAYNLQGNTNAYSSGMWACSMKYHNGKFHILINEKLPVDGWNLQGWLLTATNPEGKWEAKKLPRSYYDPGMLFDNGKVYVACGIGNITMCELDENFNFKKEKTVISGKDGLEGCHLYKHGDYYYIYATYGGWPSGQAVFRSKDIFGPYEEKMLVEKWIGGKANTVHQGALIEDVSGQWWTIMQEDLGALGRMPNLQPVKWTSDGWLSVGNGGTPYDTYTKPKYAGDNRIKRLPTTDAFRSLTLGMQWEWNHKPENSGWSLSERPGWLTLKAVKKTTTLPQARNILTQRIFADKNKPSTGTVKLDIKGLNDGDRAGICILQDPFAAIAVEKKDGKYQIVWWQAKVTDAGENFKAAEKTMAVDIPADSCIYLRATIAYSTSKTKFYYSLDNNSWKPLGSETSMSFNLTVFVGARFGLFCYPTKTVGGVASFDWFTTENNYDEANYFTDTAPEFETETALKVTKISPAATKLETLVGDYRLPVINAFYADNHKEDVYRNTAYEAETPGIVEFYNGHMLGVEQGSTKVKAKYIDVLGNESETEFTAVSSYFPFDTRYINTSIVGQGTYKKNTASSIFTFTKGCQMGWIYPQAIDMTGYKYLVVNLTTKQTAGVNLNLYTTTNPKGVCYSTPKFGDNLQLVFDLDEAKYTSVASKGKPLDRSKIQMVTFTGSVDKKTMTVKDMFLTNDEQYVPTGIAEATVRQQDSQVDVYTLSGVLVRKAADRQQAIRSLPAGVYIVGGKKVVVK